MLFIQDTQELRQEVAKQKQQEKTIALVPTMGNLHEGHLQLIDLAKKHANFIVCSIFVNPTQFGENEDFDSYPRTLDDDKHKLQERGCDLVFCPDVRSMYPKGNNQKILSRVHVPEITNYLCGKSRPGHFDGVSSVVSKLFNLVLPNVAVFGEKDFQQLAVIRTFTEDLNFPIEIIGSPISRELNGLARSSRNGYLSDPEKLQASEIYRLLIQLKKNIIGGDRNFPQLEAQATLQLNNLGFKTDYIAIRNASNLTPATTRDSKIVILIAAFLNKVRLIDNIQIEIS